MRHIVALEQRRVVDAQAALRGAALKQLSGLLDRAAGAAISVARTRARKASGRFQRARPTLRAEFGRLRSLAARLEEATVGGFKDQTTRLRTLARRLETARPTKLAHLRRALAASSRRLVNLSSAIVRAALRAGRYAGESITYTLATIAGRGENSGRERERVGSPEPKGKGVERQVDLQSTVSNDHAHAEWLLFQLQALKTNIVRRERGKPRLDLSLIPDRLQEGARKFGAHPMIQEWLNEVDRVQLNRLMTLLQGSEPVVRRGKDGLVVIRDRVPEALVEFADEKLQHDDVIRLYAEAALRRWKGAPKGRQVASDSSRASPNTGVEAASKRVADRKLPPQQHESLPPPPQSPYDQAVENGWTKGGTGVADD